MAVKNPSKPKTVTEQDWKTRYEQQAFLVGSMTSLLSRYGSSIELHQLYSSFLLTLMGQFIVADTCYYEFETKTTTLNPVLSYGRLTAKDLPRIELTSTQTAVMQHNMLPSFFENLQPEVSTAKGIKFLSRNYLLIAPLFLKEKMLGALIMGKKVMGPSFTDIDLEILRALCAVSATTFNNSLMYSNAKQSAQEIRKLYNVRDEVISRITHEFRTPLTIIKACAEMLAKTNSHTELVRLLSESELRLEDLITSLLSLSHQAPTGDQHKHSSDALALLHDCIQAFTGAVAAQKTQFNMILDGNVESPRLNISEQEIRQIFNALLGNAVKFSPPGSAITVEIETSATTPSTDRDGLQLPDWREQTEGLIREYQAIDHSESAGISASRERKTQQRDTVSKYLVIRISDNGIGIPEDDLLSVAEPFRQASNSPNLGVKGSGLGLALAHKTISAHAGYLCCRSAEGHGTKFSVFLPMAPDSNSL